MISFKRKLAINAKNISGWRTNKKIVVFAIDDYGNVRVASKKARERLIKDGVNMSLNRFDMYDTLSTSEDLEALFETLRSVKDNKGKHPIFTAFSLSTNIDFEKVLENLDGFYYEKLPDTLMKLKGYESTWDIWQQGIKEKIFYPQFHGREHLNVKLFEDLLEERDYVLIKNLENRSFAAIHHNYNKTVGFTHAYSFDKFEENQAHKDNLKDGLKVFEEVFGYKATHFNAPGAREHHVLEKTMKDNGIKYIDTDIIKNEHQGSGQYKRRYNPLGKKNELGQVYMYRNVVFEPSMDDYTNWAAKCMYEIESAFRWKKPAIISSHRVNFCGHIEPNVRKNGLKALKSLLNQIVKKWPEVEFMTSVELGELMEKSL